MTNDEKIIRRVFGRKDTPSSCEAQGLCWKAMTPQITKCVPCSKDSWSRASGWSNMTSAETETNCAGVDNIDGNVTKYDLCIEASLDCGNDTDCNELARKYAQALREGYSKDFVAFKKKVRNLGFLNTGLEWLDNMLNRPTSSSDNPYINGGGSDDDDKGLSTGAKIGIGVGILAVLGTIGYFIFKK
jgi:hypothetical protein